MKGGFCILRELEVSEHCFLNWLKPTALGL